MRTLFCNIFSSLQYLVFSKISYKYNQKHLIGEIIMPFSLQEIILLQENTTSLCTEALVFSVYIRVFPKDAKMHSVLKETMV